jgi:hypothetical protein
MKVFISWSGEMSKSIAEALREWLPYVIQAVEPWLSTEDIDKGARWGSELAQQLEDARVGVICLTPGNLEEPWIHFEAGALSKTIEETFVCPYLFQVEPTDLKGPLVQFQSTKTNKDDTQKLVRTINQALKDEALPDEQLDKAFERWWPDLERCINNIPEAHTKIEPTRSDREILEELLELVRRLIRGKSLCKTVVVKPSKDVTVDKKYIWGSEEENEYIWNSEGENV